MRICCPGTRGFSTENVRRFCKIRRITKISDNEVATFVGRFVALHGHGYWRSLIQSSIWSMLGVSSSVVPQRRVAKALHRIAPHAYESQTRDIYERANTVSYFAPYFAYKVHMDQNEKIAQGFGCTCVALIDGRCRTICGYSSMEAKNPILIFSPCDCTVRSTLPVPNRSWPRIRIMYICARSFKRIQREH